MLQQSNCSCVLNHIGGSYAVWPLIALLITTAIAAHQPPNPRQQPGATVTVFAPEQHDLYDGHYVLSANRNHMVGAVNDPVGWDHMDNEAKTVKRLAAMVVVVALGLQRRTPGTRLFRHRIPRSPLAASLFSGLGRC